MTTSCTAMQETIRRETHPVKATWVAHRFAMPQGPALPQPGDNVPPHRGGSEERSAPSLCTGFRQRQPNRRIFASRWPIEEPMLQDRRETWDARWEKEASVRLPAMYARWPESAFHHRCKGMLALLHGSR